MPRCRWDSESIVVDGIVSKPNQVSRDIIRLLDLVYIQHYLQIDFLHNIMAMVFVPDLFANNIMQLYAELVVN